MVVIYKGVFMNLMVQDIKYKLDDGKVSFPVGLLEGTINQRKSYFRDFIVEHKFLEEAVNMTISSISSQVSERLVFVCGPSGVGKKEFIKSVKRRVTELAHPILTENPGCIPVVDVEAIAPEKGSFDFVNLWRNALVNLAEPMIGHKISYSEIESYDSVGHKIIKSRVQKGDYQEILQNTLKYRNVLAMIINEAHHMLRVTSGKQVNWSADQLKTLTNGSQTPIIMVGTYELLMFLEDLDIGITDQINQRTRIINLPRYHTNKNSEINIFAKTAKMLLRNMPLEQTAEYLVDKDWEYFYTYSLGCVGTLKIWFMDAYSLALEEQAKTLTKEHLQKTRKPGHILSGMLKSIEDGERKMERVLSDGDIATQLGFHNHKSESQNDADKGVPKMKSKTKPFDRNPKRDAVGI
jgi:hypothetical protein